MKKIILIFVVSFFTFSLFAKNEMQTDTIINKIFDNKYVDTPAEFKGGSIAFSKWHNQNLVYPAAAREKSITGKVIAVLTIDEEGKIIDAYVTSKTHELLNQTVLDLIKKMPKFSPATHKGNKVKVYYEFPSNFKMAG
jgi:periplasmic protein TonB